MLSELIVAPPSLDSYQFSLPFSIFSVYRDIMFDRNVSFPWISYFHFREVIV